MATVIREAGYTGSGDASFNNPNPVTVYGRIVVQLGTYDSNSIFTTASSSGAHSMVAGAGSVASPTQSPSVTVAMTFPEEEDEYSGRGMFSYGVTPAPGNLAAGATPPGWIEIPFELSDVLQTVAPQQPSSSSSSVTPDFVYNEGAKAVTASFTIYNPNSLLGSINITGYGFESTTNALAGASFTTADSDTVLAAGETKTLQGTFNLSNMQANMTQDPVTITGSVDWSPNWTRTELRTTQTASGIVVGETTLYTLIAPTFALPAFTSA